MSIQLFVIHLLSPMEVLPTVFQLHPDKWELWPPSPVTLGIHCPLLLPEHVSLIDSGVDQLQYVIVSEDYHGKYGTIG